jgi:hypothetical protein
MEIELPMFYKRVSENEGPYNQEFISVRSLSNETAEIHFTENFTIFQSVKNTFMLATN